MTIRFPLLYFCLAGLARAGVSSVRVFGGFAQKFALCKYVYQCALALGWPTKHSAPSCTLLMPVAPSVADDLLVLLSTVGEPR